jgi:soluble lytic murein transglycosylase-like protein
LGPLALRLHKNGRGQMSKRMLVLWLSAALVGHPAAAQPLSSLLGGGSSMSSEYRDMIRPPIPGSLAGQPRRPQRIDVDEAWSIPAYTGSPGQYEQMARAAARKHAIPEDLFLRLVQTESAWRPAAVSSKGAIGLAQLMPGTAQLLRVNPHDPQQNLEGGARYLSMQYRKYGDWRLALAAYNAGPGAVDRHRGIPPYRETQDYVRRILGR